MRIKRNNVNNELTIEQFIMLQVDSKFDKKEWIECSIKVELKLSNWFRNVCFVLVEIRSLGLCIF